MKNKNLKSNVSLKKNKSGAEIWIMLDVLYSYNLYFYSNPNWSQKQFFIKRAFLYFFYWRLDLETLLEGFEKTGLFASYSSFFGKSRSSLATRRRQTLKKLRFILFTEPDGFTYEQNEKYKEEVSSFLISSVPQSSS